MHLIIAEFSRNAFGRKRIRGGGGGLVTFWASTLGGVNRNDPEKHVQINKKNLRYLAKKLSFELQKKHWLAWPTCKLDGNSTGHVSKLLLSRYKSLRTPGSPERTRGCGDWFRLVLETSSSSRAMSNFGSFFKEGLSFSTRISNFSTTGKTGTKEEILTKLQLCNSCASRNPKYHSKNHKFDLPYLHMISNLVQNVTFLKYSDKKHLQNVMYSPVWHPQS